MAKSRIISRVKRKLISVLDQVLGLDFDTPMSAEEAGLNPLYSHRSTPSGNAFLQNVLSHLTIAENHKIVDLGCGKGSAMRMMRKYPFSKITGIELSTKVASIATQNFLRLGDSRCEVRCMDAREFDEYRGYSHLYLYNPFPPQILETIIDNLMRSLSAEQDFTIIYCNPVGHEVVSATGIFVQVGDYQAEWGNRIHVYQRSLPQVPIA